MVKPIRVAPGVVATIPDSQVHGHGVGNSDSAVVRVVAGDGAEADLILHVPQGAGIGVLWLPALGVSARNYRPLAAALGARGIASALHEWRGAGSSSLRASRRCDWSYRDILETDIPASLARAREAQPDLLWIIAGHSIGGQFAALFCATHPQEFAGLGLIASGVPYWRSFSGWRGISLRMAFTVMRLIAAIAGFYPGRRLGFGGNEARSLMRDWARSGTSGRYAPAGSVIDYEAAMACSELPVFAVRLTQDAFGPAASLRWLLGKFGAAATESVELDATRLHGVTADHFSWMKEPSVVANALADWIDRRIAEQR